MELSQRAKQLSILLLEQPAGCPLTLAELSEQMHLSKRTIQRALPEVRDWMKARNCLMQSRAGSGIFLESSEKTKRDLLLELQGNAHGQESLSQQAELLELLLDAKRVLSIEQISERLFCSRDAVEKQLPWVRNWLARYQITLHVQTGVGLYIESTEKNWRRARIEHIAAFHADAVMTYFSAPERNEPPMLFRVLSREEQLSLLSILRRAQSYQEICLTDEGFLRVYLCAGLMLRRIRQGYPLQLEREELERLQRLPEYAMAEHVTDMLREHSEIAPDAAEIGFLAMYFANSDTMPKQNLAASATGELHRLYLAQRIIGAAQRELQLHFEADEQLLEGLYSHLQATCSRLRLGSPIENPLTQEMIELYPTLYAAADNACAVLKEILEIDSVPPEECAYIAMHLGAAMERMQEKTQNISAVVVCPVGMSGASHLAAEITRRFPRIVVRRIVSAIDIDTRQLRREGIDLIVSTIDLSLSYPVVRVSTLLNRRDFTRIDAALTMAIQRKQEVQAAQHPMAQRKDAAFIARFSDEMLRLTEEIPWHQIPSIQHVEELAYYAARMMISDDIAANQLEQQLAHQVHQADSYLQPYRRLFLCCQSEYVKHCCMGYLQINMPYAQDGQDAVEGCLVLLVPEKDATGAAAYLMHRACAALLRGREYLQDMQRGEKSAFAQRLERDLLQCYANIVRQHLPE